MSLHPPQYLLLPDFSAFAHVLGVRWNPLLVLIYISSVFAKLNVFSHVSWHFWHPLSGIVCFGLLATFYEAVCLFYYYVGVLDIF